jgi:hypothetical protein
MSARTEKYRADLKTLQDWEPYLRKHSGLPGPRANLELVAVVGDEADADRLWRLSASSDEFLALCGTAGLGRLVTSDPETVLPWLRELASDQRWRVREGVAMALQRLGRESMPRRGPAHPRRHHELSHVDRGSPARRLSSPAPGPRLLLERGRNRGAGSSAALAGEVVAVGRR